MSEDKGLLTITCVEGKLTRDTEVMGKMSPYCTFVFNGKKLKTKTHNYGGKKPVWGDKFQLEVESHTEELFMRVWDQDLTTSDAVGFCKIKLSSLMINNGVDDWFTITYDNKPSGEIHLTSEFASEGGDKFAQAQEEYAEQEERLKQEAEEAKAALAKV